MRGASLPLVAIAVALGSGSVLLWACSKGSSPSAPADGGQALADGSAPGADAALTPTALCSLPGTVVFGASGKTTVPGGTDPNPLDFLTLPAGFCAHYYATVPNARNIRFAPGGELFVASPTMATTGGGPGGQNAFVILPDDDGDGLPEAPITFMSFGSPSAGAATNQGMAFAPGYFYYQDGAYQDGSPNPGTKIMRVPYAAGDRAPSGAPEQVADLSVYYNSMIHWPRTIDVADDGTIYVANPADQDTACDPTHPPIIGGILKIDPAPGGPNPNGVPVAKGFRNPISIRCEHGKGLCFAIELAKDYTYGVGREKLVPIRSGDDWGFPCCATQGLQYDDVPDAGGCCDCTNVVPESNSFYISTTPFSLDFEPGNWPAPWTHQIFIATHGAAGTWNGARMVAIPVDSSGMPQHSVNVDAGDVEGMTDFATGWDDGSKGHGRPGSVAFSHDGRLFLASDQNGVIFWISPTPQ
jgi:glucose/arabinose dehydrogenase